MADAIAVPLTTKLITTARAKNKIAIPGFMMASYQSASQFKIYTEREAPLELVRQKMRDMAKA